MKGRIHPRSRLGRPGWRHLFTPSKKVSVRAPPVLVLELYAQNNPQKIIELVHARFRGQPAVDEELLNAVQEAGQT